jgi:hypothetical protein
MQSWADCIIGTFESSFWKRQPLSLELCTFPRRYGFETPFKTGVSEASAGVEFEINTLDRPFDNSSGYGYRRPISNVAVCPFQQKTPGVAPGVYCLK